jgi:hypothetical protein
MDMSDNPDWLSHVPRLSDNNKHLITISVIYQGGRGPLANKVVAASSGIAALKLIDVKQKGRNRYHDGLLIDFVHPLRMYVGHHGHGMDVLVKISIDGQDITVDDKTACSLNKWEEMSKTADFRSTNKDWAEKYFVISALELSAFHHASSEIYTAIIEQYVRKNVDTVVNKRKN